MASKLSKPVWIILTIIITGFTAFVVVRNLLHIWSISSDLRELERQEESYREQIEADSTLIENLKYDDLLQEYARERFNMQREDEQVFIVK